MWKFFELLARKSAEAIQWCRLTLSVFVLVFSLSRKDARLRCALDDLDKAWRLSIATMRPFPRLRGKVGMGALLSNVSL